MMVMVVVVVLLVLLGGFLSMFVRSNQVICFRRLHTENRKKSENLRTMVVVVGE